MSVAITRFELSTVAVVRQDLVWMNRKAFGSHR